MQIHGFHEGLNLAREIERSFPIIFPQNINLSPKGVSSTKKNKNNILN